MEEGSSSHSGYCVCLLSSWVHPAQVRVLLRTGHTFLKKYDLYGIVFLRMGRILHPGLKARGGLLKQSELQRNVNSA